MPRFRRLRSSDIAFKIGDDPVTIADKAAEKALSQRLLALLPDSTVVGEEDCAANPCVLERFSGESPVWIIDPIDGTRNFVAGKPTFGGIVALAKRNQWQPPDELPHPLSVMPAYAGMTLPKAWVFSLGRWHYLPGLSLKSEGYLSGLPFQSSASAGAGFFRVMFGHLAA